MRTLEEVVYAHIVALGSGWVIHECVRWHPDGGHSTGALEGCGGAEEPLIRYCLPLGVPVLDFSAPGCDVRGPLNILDGRRPREVAPWYGGTLETFVVECLAAGARLIE
jgi:hypothetical protein